jgi:hypothetical protein
MPRAAKAVLSSRHETASISFFKVVEALCQTGALFEGTAMTLRAS